jgi:thiamine kinase-like enzyme
VSAQEAITHVLGYPGAAELLARLGSEAVSAEPITTSRPQGSQRFAYRVELADGLVVKVRRPERPERAARAWRLLELLGDPRFAVVIMREGDLVVEEWIEGTSLAGRTPRPEHVAGAAAFLASLHRARIDGVDAGRIGAPTELRDATCSRIEGLRRLALLGVAEVQTLCGAVRRLAPAVAATGITHNDLCGENIVIDTAGEIRVVDNEDVAPRFVDFDLARTWYRWQLEPAAWEHFVSRYATEGGRRPDADTFEFWKIAAVAKSAVESLAATPEQRERALARLQGLAA